MVGRLSLYNNNNKVTKRKPPKLFSWLAESFDANPNEQGFQLFNNPNKKYNLYDQLLSRNNLESYQGRSPQDELRFGYNNVFDTEGANPYDSRYVREDLLGNRNFSKSQLTDLQKENIINKSYTDNNLPVPENEPIFLNNLFKQQSNQPNIEDANKMGGILNANPVNEKSIQPNTEIANDKGLLVDNKSQTGFQGLLDKAVQFATSDFGRDFFMGMDTGYSEMPTTFMDSIKSGYDYATTKEKDRRDEERADEELDIKRIKANQLDPRGQPVYRYMIRDSKGNNYNAFSHRGEIYANINGKRVLQKDWEKTLGGSVDIRTPGQQTFGISNIKDFGQIETDLLSQEQSLNSYARYLNLQKNTNTGMLRLGDTYSGIFKTFFGKGLTEEELNTKIANGELQRLIGASRKEIVGGGVMTEQDALRIINALGGNVDALQDPEQVKRAISQIFKEKYQSYNLNLKKYNYNVAQEYRKGGYKIKEPLKFTKTQLSVLDPNITTDLGLINYDDLSNNELLKINQGNLSPENVKLLFEEMKKRELL